MIEKVVGIIRLVTLMVLNRSCWLHHAVCYARLMDSTGALLFVGDIHGRQRQETTRDKTINSYPQFHLWFVHDFPKDVHVKVSHKSYSTT